MHTVPDWDILYTVRTVQYAVPLVILHVQYTVCLFRAWGTVCIHSTYCTVNDFAMHAVPDWDIQYCILYVQYAVPLVILYVQYVSLVYTVRKRHNYAGTDAESMNNVPRPWGAEVLYCTLSVQCTVQWTSTDSLRQNTVLYIQYIELYIRSTETNYV